MGKVSILCWFVESDKYNVEDLEEFIPNGNIELLPYNKNVVFSEKRKIIKGLIKKYDSISLKMPLVDAIIGCHYAVKYKKKYVIESAGSSFKSLWYHGGFKYKIAAFPVEALVKHYHRKAKYIVYVSKFYLQRFYKSKAKQIGCPDVVLDNPDSNVLNARLNKIKFKSAGDKRFVLGLIGASQAEYRGHDVLLKAAGLLKKEGYLVSVQFLGGGTADDKRKQVAVKNNIENEVTFCGRLPHDEVLNWIDQIDILVMPTKVESLGRAVIEAMSRACPVIGTVGTALEEQLGSDCLIKPTDYIGLANLLKNMIDDVEYLSLCAVENFYRSFKYTSSTTNKIKKRFYDNFYLDSFKTDSKD